MKTLYVKPAQAERKWFVVDAEGQVLGRLASKIAAVVRGKEKVFFAPHHELGDYVVVINAAKIVVTGAKEQDKMYYKHSGYIGGLKQDSFTALRARHPTAPLEAAIKGMLPKGPLGRKLLKNVKLYPGAEHPHSAQNPQPLGLER